MNGWFFINVLIYILTGEQTIGFVSVVTYPALTAGQIDKERVVPVYAAVKYSG